MRKPCLSRETVPHAPRRVRRRPGTRPAQPDGGVRAIPLAARAPLGMQPWPRSTIMPNVGRGITRRMDALVSLAALPGRRQLPWKRIARPPKLRAPGSCACGTLPPFQREPSKGHLCRHRWCVQPKAAGLGAPTAPTSSGRRCKQRRPESRSATISLDVPHERPEARKRKPQWRCHPLTCGQKPRYRHPPVAAGRTSGYGCGRTMPAPP